MSLLVSDFNSSKAADYIVQPAVPGPDEHPAPVAEQMLVYVVENDRISSVITELIVRKNLCGQVQCHAHGQSAFDALAAAVHTGGRVPLFVLLDLDMPVMDGWEFLDALTELVPVPHTAVLVLTSSIHPNDLVKAASYPQVKGFFTKPLDEASVASLHELMGAAGPAAHGASPAALTLNFAPNMALRA